MVPRVSLETALFTKRRGHSAQQLERVREFDRTCP